MTKQLPGPMLTESMLEQSMQAISLPFLTGPEDWTLPVPTALREQAWNQSRNQGSKAACWRSYVNRLATGLLQALFQAEGNQPTVIWPSQEQQSEIWEIVTGSSITLTNTTNQTSSSDGHRLVILPTESLDDEFSVPQEWVDIPSWMGDYYVSVQLTPEESHLRILGYATHQQLKAQADYDAFDRSYNLAAEDLITWENFEPTYQEYSHNQTQSEVPELVQLNGTQAQNLLKRLGNPEQLMPRLEVPFQQWAALIENPQWRKQLYRDRTATVSSSQTSTVNVTQQAKSNFTQLSNWLQGEIETVWQGIETLLLPPTEFARGSAPRGHGALTPGVARAKRLRLSDDIEVILSVTIEALEETALEESRRIVLKLDPTPEAQALPSEVELRLLSPEGEELGQARAATSETIRIQFRATEGEQFQVEVLCGDISIRERFEV